LKREEKLAKNTFILGIGMFLPKVAVFITVPILTGYLTKEEYGIYDLILVLVTFILPVATLQIQTAAFRFLIDVREDETKTKKIITNIYAFIIPVSIVTLAILYLFFPSDSSMIRLLVCVYFFVDILLNAARQCVRGLGRNKDYTISALISSFGKIVFIIIFIWYFKGGLFGALLAMVSACSLAFCVLSAKTRLLRYIDLSLISWNEIKELISYSWAMVPNSMSMSVMRVSDRLVVTAVMGPAANAVYAVANKIPNILHIAQTTFTMAWQENASIVSKDEDAGQYYSSMFRVMFDLMAGCLGLLICATPLLFKLLIRGDYAEAYLQMPLLFLAMFFYSMCAYLGGIYVAYKDIKSVGITTMAAAACNLVVDIALIRWIGLFAASGSTFVSYLFLFIFRILNVRKLVSIKYDYIHMFTVFGILVIESILCVMQKPALNMINIALGIVVFFVLNKKFIRVMWAKGKNLLLRKKS